MQLINIAALQGLPELKPRAKATAKKATPPSQGLDLAKLITEDAVNAATAPKKASKKGAGASKAAKPGTSSGNCVLPMLKI